MDFLKDLFNPKEIPSAQTIYMHCNSCGGDPYVFNGKTLGPNKMDTETVRRAEGIALGHYQENVGIRVIHDTTKGSTSFFRDEAHRKFTCWTGDETGGCY